jgi:hypothetical protein
MSIENLVLVSNYSNDSQPTVESYSDKQKGAGHHKFNDSVHTAVFELDNFVGSIKLQGTLALYPGNDDWVDIVYDTASHNLTALDSTPVVAVANATFTGKFVWIRAAYTLEQGVITQIRFKY